MTFARSTKKTSTAFKTKMAARTEDATTSQVGRHNDGAPGLLPLFFARARLLPGIAIPA
jgi:hypothetical protein